MDYEQIHTLVDKINIDISRVETTLDFLRESLKTSEERLKRLWDKLDQIDQTVSEIVKETDFNNRLVKYGLAFVAAIGSFLVGIIGSPLVWTIFVHRP